MPEEAAVSRRHLAELELQQGHLLAAIEQAGKAEDSFRRREDPRGASDAGLLHVDALLAAHADAAARTALDALAPELAEASSEQRAIALVLRAELARRQGDGRAAALALQQARQLAAASGIRQLQLRIELARARSGQPSGGLDDATATLGNAGLRLQWLQLAMQGMLAARQPARAVTAYKEAAELLRAGDCLYASDLHALGATAYAASGDPAAAAAARARAGDALAVLRSGLPAGLRAGFDAAVAREPPP
jgi:ATP/maltotriose-dependent transcriptional regulator MalT